MRIKQTLFQVGGYALIALGIASMLKGLFMAADVRIAQSERVCHDTYLMGECCHDDYDLLRMHQHAIKIASERKKRSDFPVCAESYEGEECSSL